MDCDTKILAIRRENKNKWERRVAITPKHCKALIDQGFRIIMQSSQLRCYTDHQYTDVGVEVTEDISSADVILGVKEVPLDYLLPDKTYMYFSHTLKGQAMNMPALNDILKKNIRLIDYELIKDQNPDPKKSERLVAFGRYAGLAGAVDFLQGIGEFLLHKALYTPFIYTGYSYMFPSVEEAKNAVNKVGEMIKLNGLPKEICPFIIGLTSNGRVSKGAQEVLINLPHEYIDPDALKELFDGTREVRSDIVYLTVMESRHIYANRDGKPFDKTDFYLNPKNYVSKFAESYIPYLSILYHCMYWNADSDKILTVDKAHQLAEEKKFRMFGISDITCDIDGSVEFLQEATSIEKPFFSIDPLTNIKYSDFSKMTDNSILYHAVDHLPAEFPIDASNHFSEKLYPFMKQILESRYPCDYTEINDLPPEISNACETWNGKLTPRFAYLKDELGKYFRDYAN